MRLDACIIGAGAEGLACAAWLAARGVKVKLVERAGKPGGRCTTRAFATGHLASPYADSVPAVPPAVFRALDLGRRGVFFEAARGLADPLREAVIARVMADAVTPPRRLFARPPPPWPGEELAGQALAAPAAAAPSCDPHLEGSAVTALAGPAEALVQGGLGALAQGLRVAAEEAGADITCGLEVTDIRRHRDRVSAVGLSDGSEIAARAVVSTLDLKRTFLSLFSWTDLPKPVVERVGAWRAAPGVARLLVALSAPPGGDLDVLRRPIVLPGASGEAYAAWRSGVVPDNPPAVVRLVSAVDPFLAPPGAATLTVTLGAIPHKPFDGAWNEIKRTRLTATAVKLIERALPGTMARIAAAVLLVPPDIEAQLGLTEGDLFGGALTPSQMLSLRPFAGCRGTRTPIAGLYLAGPSSALGPLATCASGVAAAVAVLADLKAGRLP